MEPFQVERFNAGAPANTYRAAIYLSFMSFFLRRIATLILFLTVPLRVYAAAAMVFCGPGNDPAAVQSVVPAHHQMHASMHGHHADTEHFPSVDGPSAAGAPDRAAPYAVSFDGHFSCAGCCYSGMIATARFDWKPQAFSKPAMATFIVTAVPSTVPQRLERPPKAILA